MKHWFLLMAATAAFTAFAPASGAELGGHGWGVRISEPPQQAELRGMEPLVLAANSAAA